MTRRRLLLAAAALAAALLGARLLAAAYADYVWYAALDAQALWRAKAVNTVLLRGSAWAAAVGIVFANLYAVRSSVFRLIVPRRVANLEIDAEVPGRLLVGGALLVSVGVGALLMLAQDDWSTLATARYTGRFGEYDSAFGHDLRFWTAWLPLERAWYSWAQATLVVTTCMVVTLYALTSSLRWERGALHVAPHVRRHLSILGALLLLLFAWGYRIERFLLVVDGGPAGFFGPADRAALGALLALAVLTITCAFLVAWGGYTGQTRIAFAGITAAIVLAIGLQHLAPALLRWSARAERDAVTPFLATRTTFTQRAYGLRDRVAPADTLAAFADVNDLAGRVPLWDDGTVVAAIERAGRRRIVVGHVGWQVDDADRLVAVAAARDGDAEGADAARGWVAAMAPAAGADAIALPDGTLRATTRALPPVYVHAAARAYTVAPDPSGAIRAPVLADGWRRVAHALAVQNPRIALDPMPGARTVLVDHRSTHQRVRRLAPTFALGATVSPIVHADSLLWAVHLYAHARTYPISHPVAVPAGHAGEPALETKYFRHAATALVNAHTGAVRILRVDDADPLARGWMDRFPSIFRPWGDVPPALLRAIPPAGDAIAVQAAMLAAAGGAGLPAGRLRLPDRDPADSLAVVGPLAAYATPGPGSVTALALPLVDRDDDRLRALVIARGGANPRTTVVPVDRPVAPWSTVLGRMDSATAALAGGEDAGERVVRGRVRVVPVRGGAALLRPSFAWRSDAGPTLRSVVLAGPDSVRAARTLAAALGAAAAAPGATAEAQGDAGALFRAMRDALRRADWHAFGDAFEALGRTLGEPAAAAPPDR